MRALTSRRLQVGELNRKIDALSGEVHTIEDKSAGRDAAAKDKALARLVQKAAASAIEKEGLTWQQGTNDYDPNCPCRGGCPSSGPASSASCATGAAASGGPGW